MSPRAAWRLETLGFMAVYEYAAGKADWGAYGLPLEGTVTNVSTIQQSARLPRYPSADHASACAKGRSARRRAGQGAKPGPTSGHENRFPSAVTQRPPTYPTSPGPNWVIKVPGPQIVEGVSRWNGPWSGRVFGVTTDP